MLFYPEPLEEWNDLERFFRALHFAKLEPDEPRWAREAEAYRARFNFDRDVAALWNSPDAVFREEFIFLPGYDVAMLRHFRYMPFGWHSHDFFELIYVCRGGCEHAVGEKSFHLGPGDLVILPPGLRHRIYTEDDEAIVVNLLMRRSSFDRAFAPLTRQENLLSQFFQHTLYARENADYLLFACGDDAVIRGHIEAMYAEYIARAAYSPEALDAQLCYLLAILLRRHRDDARWYESRTRANSLPISRILDHIQRNLRSVTLAELARDFHYSASYLSRAINEATGASFTRLVAQERARRAAQLLRETELSVAEIAEQSGYADASHLHRSFRTLHHLTPTQYRQQQREIANHPNAPIEKDGRTLGP